MNTINEQMNGGAAMNEEEFVWLLTAVRPADRAGVLEQIRLAVESARK